MKNNVKEANVVMARCASTSKSFGIHMERRTDDVWYCTWAFPLSEKSASNEGYTNTVISGRMEFDDEYPGCPHCNSTGWVKCWSCGKLTCWSSKDKSFSCKWCGVSGEVESADEFELNAGGY